MKIYFNRRPVEGPWGGGSKVLKALIDESIARGHTVLYEDQLKFDKSIDVLFCVDPRPSSQVTFRDILNHRMINHHALMVQRIGDLGTHGKPDLFELVSQTVKYSDIAIFPSVWALDYLNNKILRSFVIPNAPHAKFTSLDNKLFPFIEGDTIKIVSHHWSNNSMKGFDLYESLDLFIRQKSLINREFTFIGRHPEGTIFDRQLDPLDIEGLVSEIPKHNVYVTASKLEAGANHVLEAISLGLPVLYHKDGGSINEYCLNYGMQYDNFDQLINILKDDALLKSLIDRVNSNRPKRNLNNMASEYLELIELELERKNNGR